MKRIWIYSSATGTQMLICGILGQKADKDQFSAGDFTASLSCPWHGFIAKQHSP
jgi:hypothetical protein